MATPGQNNSGGDWSALGSALPQNLSTTSQPTFGGVKINDLGADHVITIQAQSNESADRILTIPELGGDKYLAITSNSNGSVINGPIFNGFRLTLESGVPVSTSDQSAKTTLYFTPYTGNVISLYDGSTTWNHITSAEVSLALGTLSDATNYDVFVYNNSGTLTIDTLVAWTNATTRATALTLQNGVNVKTGATTRLYVGTIRTTATTTTEDSLLKRYVYNAYNQMPRPLYVTDSTNSWSYVSTTRRQANGSTANQISLVVGLAGNPMHAHVYGRTENTGTSAAYIGIGYDSTTTNASGISGQATQFPASCATQVGAALVHFPGIGKHDYVWLEAGGGAGTQTWYGDSNTPDWSNSGLSGVIRM